MYILYYKMENIVNLINNEMIKENIKDLIYILNEGKNTKRKRQILQIHQMKECSKCEQIKKWEDFGKDIKGGFGLAPQCKDCKILKNKNYYAENNDELFIKRWNKKTNIKN